MANKYTLFIIGVVVWNVIRLQPLTRGDLSPPNPTGKRVETYDISD